MCTIDIININISEQHWYHIIGFVKLSQYENCYYFYLTLKAGVHTTALNFLQLLGRVCLNG